MAKLITNIIELRTGKGGSGELRARVYCTETWGEARKGDTLTVPGFGSAKVVKVERSQRGGVRHQDVLVNKA